MEQVVEQQATLRDDLLASFDAVESGTPAVDAPPIETQETESQKADRLRDEAGRFAKEDPKPSAPQAQKPSAGTSTDKAKSAPAVAGVQTVDRPKYPSTFKKGFEQVWDGLDPGFLSEIARREGDYAKGVSTYKQEADSARQLNEAIAPFLPNLQRHGMEPTQWIRNLGTAHERLALGSPQDKVMVGAQLIRDYGIDPQALFQALSAPPQQQTYQPQYQPPQPQINIDEVVEQKLTQREIQSEYNRFVTDAPEKYPHYEQVKDTMAGLLSAGLAQDYPSAYEAALRHPRHTEIYEQAQQQRLQQENSAQAAQKQAVANRARSNAVSVKSSTPSGTMTMAANGNNSLRDDVSAAFDAVTSSRV